MPIIQYDGDGDKKVEEKANSLTLLEISVKNNIPHTQACRGNARCSTCRIIVLEGFESLSPPTEAEITLARKKGFANNIRLACQAKVNSDVKIRPLILDNDDIKIAMGEKEGSTGDEQKVAILFSDIRGFTSLSENGLTL